MTRYGTLWYIVTMSHQFVKKKTKICLFSVGKLCGSVWAILTSFWSHFGHQTVAGSHDSPDDPLSAHGCMSAETGCNIQPLGLTDKAYLGQVLPKFGRRCCRSIYLVIELLMYLCICLCMFLVLVPSLKLNSLELPTRRLVEVMPHLRTHSGRKQKGPVWTIPRRRYRIM